MSKIRIFYIGLLIVSLAVTFYDIKFVAHEGYKNLYILPLVFMFVMAIRFIYIPKGIVIKIIDLIYFTKFVILSFLVVYSNWYEGRAVFPPQIESLNKALLFMVFEFLCVNIFYFFGLRKVDINIKENKLNLKIFDFNKDVIYKTYIIISLTFLIYNYKSISILGMTHSEYTFESNQLTIFFNICLYISKYLILGYIIRYFYVKYSKKPKGILIIYSLIIVLLICSVFIGTNRMDAVLPILSIFVLMNYLYKKRMQIYNFIFPIFILLAIYTISVVRNTFSYQITDSKAALITDYIQIYINGVYNTAISLELNSISNNPILTFTYDLIRPFLGLNFLWRSETVKTSSEIFNYKIFGIENHVTQIIPLIGQFHLPFGIFGIPVYVFLITILLYIFLKFLSGIYIIEAMIILPLIFRLCITYFQNISIFINELSSILIIFIVLKITSIGLRKLSEVK
ncbi:O-antigen polymerase [Mammaliicoccus sciuri]|uniref:O-antigen polymerase n=1 Tax=Mammaliicoccus sciuri TaxID=1296 RepID=UPI001299D538|nr:O-antigen polymerase [Mammaliicoccus sciuri]MRE71916.1 hypothetical protein [Mammaliicoccus sciuri]